MYRGARLPAYGVCTARPQQRPSPSPGRELSRQLALCLGVLAVLAVPVGSDAAPCDGVPHCAPQVMAPIRYSAWQTRAGPIIEPVTIRITGITIPSWDLATTLPSITAALASSRTPLPRATPNKPRWIPPSPIGASPAKTSLSPWVAPSSLRGARRAPAITLRSALTPAAPCRVHRQIIAQIPSRQCAFGPGPSSVRTVQPTARMIGCQFGALSVNNDLHTQGTGSLMRYTLARVNLR